MVVLSVLANLTVTVMFMSCGQGQV